MQGRDVKTGLAEWKHAPEADSRQKMRRSLPNTCSEATVEMAASVSIVFTAFPLTSSSSQLVPCTAPAQHGDASLSPTTHVQGGVLLSEDGYSERHPT
jgi:hypothetical protein